VDIKELESVVRKHPGIIDYCYTVRTRSVLLRYEPKKVSEAEILLRVALCLSRDYELAPVRVFYANTLEAMTPTALVSGFAILVSGVVHLFPRITRAKVILDWVAGIGTVGAVLEHALSDVRSLGRFHPESLSVVYLLTAFARANVLPAATITWVSTFGRHLVKPLRKGVEIRAVETKGGWLGRRTSYAVTVTEQKGFSGGRGLLQFFPAVLADALSGGKPGESRLLEKIKDLSFEHGDTIEGLSELKNGITIRTK
jgi:hypothetical protein